MIGYVFWLRLNVLLIRGDLNIRGRLMIYKSVSHALRSAYFTAAKDPYKRPAMNTVCDPMAKGEPVSWDELAGQAGMIFSEIREHLTENQKAVVDALYIVPETKSFEMQKINACLALAEDLSKEHSIDLLYLQAAVTGWSGITMVHSEQWWADKLGKTTRTLRHWRHGNVQRHKPGIFGSLDFRLDMARSKLSPAFRENGWIA